MKGFLVFRGLLLLFTLIWTCPGEQPDLKTSVCCYIANSQKSTLNGGSFTVSLLGACLTSMVPLYFLTLSLLCRPIVYVRCSPSLFLARVKTTAFGNDLPMAPNEVFLGNQCPVTMVHQGFYEFRYHPSNCNIRMEVLSGDRILFVSEIIFMSMFSNLEAFMPVACVVPRHPAPIRTTIGNGANKQGGPPKILGITHLYIGEIISQDVKRNNFAT